MKLDDIFNREMKVVVEKIKDFKKRNNLTYEEIGNTLNVNRSHIHRIVKMEVFPSFHFLVQLSKYMGISLSSMFAHNDKDLITDNEPNEQRLELIKALLFEMGLEYSEVQNSIEYIKTFIK